MHAPLFTVGHGASSAEALLALLRASGIEALVDIRRFPGSAAHPHVGREALASWLPDDGIAYRWEPRLGGRRRLPKGTASPDTWWTVEAFRAYAAHTRTCDFSAALAELLQQADTQPVTVMCSETVRWRCHRRLVADVVVLGHDRPVLHLLPAGPRPHQPAPGARVGDDGQLVWDVGALSGPEAAGA